MSVRKTNRSVSSATLPLVAWMLGVSLVAEGSNMSKGQSGRKWNGLGRPAGGNQILPPPAGP